MNKLLIVGGAIALTIGALFIKNSIEEKNTRPLTKQQIIHILKLLRKNKYLINRQVATFAANMIQQMKGNLNPQMIEQFLSGPESPVQIKAEVEATTENICKSINTNLIAFNTGLQKYSTDADVQNLINQQNRDYQISLSGKMPPFQVDIPESFTKERFITVQNQLTKNTYLKQVALFKKLSQYSEEELQQNPQLLSEFGNHEQQQEERLIEEGLGTQYNPAFAVYESASAKYRNDPNVRAHVARLEGGYQKILERYAAKLQEKTITEADLNNMQSEIQRFNPSQRF